MTDIVQPISLRFLPDGRLLVAQKNGKIRIANVGVSPAQWELYLDLASAQHAHGIASDQERGLLDLAIDPNFPTQPYVYLYYTPATGPNGPRARIARFTHVANSGGTTSRASPSSEVILWQDTDGYDNCCHFGGGLDFGPDGKLWLTVGDHFEGSYASSLRHAGGKVHRINKNGTIPPDNPYVDGAGPNVDSTFAYGLRNPFRSRWDLSTGRYFIAEVGGNTQSIAWEDLHWIQYDMGTGRFVDADYGTAGDNGVYDGINFGWPTVEGLPPHNDFPGWQIDDVVGEPMFAYRHSGQSSALTGGVVYRGTQFPAHYRGAYFYADSTRRIVRYIKFNADGLVQPNPNPDPVISKKNPDTISYLFDPEQLGRVIALEQSPNGALYYVTFAETTGGGNEPTAPGSVRRYVYDGGNGRPLIQTYTANPISGAAPLSVAFQVKATDPELNSMTYRIDFGDGQSTAVTPLPQNVAVNVSHTYTVQGLFTATLTVSDGSKSAVGELELSIGSPPVVTSFTSTNSRAGSKNDMFRFGDVITFAANATDGAGNPLSGSHFEWEIAFVRPDTLHPSFGPVSGVKFVDFSIPTQGQGFSGDVFYRCFLTVTGNNGLETNATLDIYPEKANITFGSVPSGIVVQVEGNTAMPAPFVLDTLINYNHTITVPASVCIGGRKYAFSRWSNGVTTPQQVFTMPPNNVTLTASYVDVGTCSGPPASGLVTHFKSNAGLVLSGSSVRTWEDQTSLNNHLASAGAPTLLANQVNGRSAVHFDGVDDALSRSGTNGLPTLTQDRSVFMVARYNSLGTGSGWAGFGFGSTSSNQAFGLSLTPTGLLGVQAWGSANDIVSSPPTNGLGPWLTQGAVLKSNVLTQYRDGSPIGTASHVYNTGANTIRLGEELNGKKNLNMDVAEVLVYNRALTSNELEQLFSYFFFEYGIGSGPSNSAPSVTVTSPANNSLFERGVAIDFQGSATDVQDGSLTASLAWRSSLDGPIGSGGSFSTSGLSVGTHAITATATDSSGLQGQASIGLTVTEPTAVPFAGSLVLELDSTKGVTRAGALVSAWNDLSGFNNHVFAIGDPQFVLSATPSGLPAIALDGAGDALERINATHPLLGLPAGNADRSMFLVVRYHAAGPVGGAVYGTGAVNQAFGLGVRQSTGNLVLQGWGSTRDLHSSSLGVGVGWLVQSGRLSSGVAAHYKNGVAIGQKTNTYNTVVSRLSLGREISQLGFQQMDVAAVLIYDRALTNTERAQVENYLQEKYLGSGL